MCPYNPDRNNSIPGFTVNPLGLVSSLGTKSPTLTPDTGSTDLCPWVL